MNRRPFLLGSTSMTAISTTAFEPAITATTVNAEVERRAKTRISDEMMEQIIIDSFDRATREVLTMGVDFGSGPVFAVESWR